MKIYCDSSTREACVVVEGHDPMIFPYFRTLTVNEGEYMAMYFALEHALASRLQSVVVLSDSQLVVNQVNGVYRVRKPHLILLKDAVLVLVKRVGATIKWIPREENLAGLVLE